MKKIGLYVTLSSAIAIVISGCASTGVVPLEKGVYYISKSDESLQFAGSAPTGSVIASVYKEARTFCAKNGGEFKSIKKEFITSEYGKMPSFSLEFTCVKK